MHCAEPGEHLFFERPFFYRVSTGLTESNFSLAFRLTIDETDLAL